METATNSSVFQSVRLASGKLIDLNVEHINQILTAVAKTAVDRSSEILAENQRDLDQMDPSNPKYDRLMLTAERIRDIASDIKKVVELKSPIGDVLEHRVLENGLDLQKVRVPLGVIGMIYEARPNVSFDVFSLCLKTKNACILKGGSDARFSNQAIVSLIHDVLREHGVDENVVQLLPHDRNATSELLHAVDEVDVIIPRGSQELIQYVRAHAKVPVIETGAGIVHVYFDESGDVTKGRQIVCNAKTRRVSVCNALDCLLIHQNLLPRLSEIVGVLAEQQTVIYADERANESLTDKYPSELLHPAGDEHFGTEFLSNKLAIKIVSGMEEALRHIAIHSSKHSEAVIAEDDAVIDRFLKSVDAAVVYSNTSTAFTDGAQMGLGAEIGISTQKLHARGPMALEEITTYKWIIRGDGQVRD